MNFFFASPWPRKMVAAAICLLFPYGALSLSSTASAQSITPSTSNAEGASPQAGILNSASVPSWFQTGHYRASRWDGGPIEAEKGMLSGWPGYTQNDPQKILQATRDWYSPKTIQYLKMMHVNWAWVTWSTGFSPETESQQRELVSRYIKLCHQNHIRVTAYISIGNIFWHDMFEHVPESIAWTKLDFRGGPVYYSRPNRYMADIANPGWIALETQRVESAARAGADGLWIDNTFSYYSPQDVSRMIDTLYSAAVKINPHFLILSNYNPKVLTWARFQNAVSTENGKEPGYYTDSKNPPLVTNAGLLRYLYGISEGWRPVSVEDGGRHTGNRLLNPMEPKKWQLALAECAMYHASLEINPEGRFLRDIYFETPAAMNGLHAIGIYNSFFERNEQYYIDPNSMAKIAVLSDTTDTIIPYLDELSKTNVNYDVLFNYQTPDSGQLKRYKVIVLPNTNPLDRQWIQALTEWVRQDGGVLVSVQDASLFTARPVPADQDFGLGPLLGISKSKIPTEKIVRTRGIGTVIYLPELLAAPKMAALLNQYARGSELVKVTPQSAILSNLAYQPKYRRIILHLLNYRQALARNIHVEVHAPVEKVLILSPDRLVNSTAKLAQKGTLSEITIPELQTYDLVAIYLKTNNELIH